MNIYVSHSRNFDFREELYKPLRYSSLNTEHSLILPHETSDEPFKTKELFDSKKCDVILAEVSFPATGQGIELGWADLLHIPIVCLYKSGTKPSGSLKIISQDFIEYEGLSSIIPSLEQLLFKYEHA